MIGSILHIIDWLLWIFMACSVCYVVFFSLASLLRRNRSHECQLSASSFRFLILVPAYHEDAVVINSVKALLQQDYPTEDFCVTVISDNMSDETNHLLSTMPITLLQPSFEKSSKAKALQYAIEHFKVQKGFDYVVILDADNVVESDFLGKLKDSCAKGYQAIQCHRTAKNAENNIAMLDGISEEINNTIFRRAHNNIGLSAALIGSGMCFTFEWFTENVAALSSAVEDRELEVLLMEQHIFIRYEECIKVMDEKVSNKENFQRQRLRWMTGQLQSLFSLLPKLPHAIASGNINLVDKTIQQMLIPRSILIILVSGMSVLMTVLAFPWCIKWWGMLLLFLIALLIAIPSNLRSKHLVKSLISLPRLVWQMIFNLTKINPKNKDFIHTTHDK